MDDVPDLIDPVLLAIVHAMAELVDDDCRIVHVIVHDVYIGQPRVGISALLAR
jgi:Holliday junction resolvase RusA-like endonuclease